MKAVGRRRSNLIPYHVILRSGGDAADMGSDVRIPVFVPVKGHPD
jgi:hypothetical protein